MQARITALAVLIMVLAWTGIGTAAETAQTEIAPFHVDQRPVIDGSLEDAVWQQAPTVSARFVSYWPHQGEVLPFLTEVWAGYDEANLYFAFYAHDVEPDKIQASITKRDNIVPEDWVGVLVNTAGNRQSGYGFYSNPSGIQYDELVASAGDDPSPDWVWDSNARRLSDGYSVEMRIPLKSIVYQSGSNVRMCLMFFRKVSRLGYVTSWPTIAEGSNSLRASVDATYGKLESEMRLEILPSVTSGNVWRRESPGPWPPASNDTQLGVDLSLGMTASTAADLTYHPDFSQVESDTFQILVNQRFPVFFEEKRPFFMELGNQFAMAKNSSSNLLTGLNTRRIVAPRWGVKARGERGRLSLGVLGAEDELDLGSGGDDNGGPSRYFAARLKHGLGGDSFVGLLATDTGQGPNTNRVIAGDVLYNVAGAHTVKGNLIYTASKAPNDGPANGLAYHFDYAYATRRLLVDLMVEQFDQDFRMDTAFYSRTGFRSYAGSVGPSFYPGGRLRIDRIRPTARGIFIEDQASGLDEYFVTFNLWLGFPRQATLSGNYRVFQEVWQQRNFAGEYFDLSGGIQATGSLRLDGYYRWGDRVFYDPVRPLVGPSQMYQASSTLQFSQRLSQFIQYTYQDLSDRSSGERVYDVNITTSRTTFQLNRYLFFRLTAQRDSSRDILLTDFLVSFTFIPGTVLHVGYGSLYEESTSDGTDQAGGRPTNKLYQTNKSLFFKASYRWRR